MFTVVGLNIASMFWMVFSKETKVMRLCSFWSTKMSTFLPFSIMLLLISSIYLVIFKWDWEIPWIDVSLVTLIIITVTSITIDTPRLKAINAAINAETVSVPSLEMTEMARDHVLWNSVSIMTMEVAAVIHIMIEKLGTVGSLITVGLALIVGLLFSKAVLRLANRFNPIIVDKEIVNF
jgi:hypothetical protein